MTCLNDAGNKIRDSLKQATTLLEELTEAGQDYSEADAGLKRLLKLQADLEALKSHYRNAHIPQAPLDFADVHDWSIVEKYKHAKERQWHVHHPNTPLPPLEKDGRVRCYSEQQIDPMLSAEWEDESAEISVASTRQQQQSRCPITQEALTGKALKGPCGHLFSETGIRQYLSNQDRECPVAGCGHRLRQSHLQAVILSTTSSDDAEDSCSQFKLFH